MRGCRGGVSPCAGLGGSPTSPIRQESFRAGAAGRPRWKRRERTPASQRPHRRDIRRARSNDLIRPRCARPPSPEGKAWLPYPPALETAGTHACVAATSPARHAVCRSSDLIRPRCARPPSPEGKASVDPAVCVGYGGNALLRRSDLTGETRGMPEQRPHPTSLRSATFPRGEGFG